jgi:quaternary ammonium compound-resistance protein SugE
MSWLLLLLSGLIEAGWAIGLKASAGLTRPLPTALTLAGMIVSLALLSLAARSVPVGTAYAVWVGIGTIGATALGILFYAEPVSAPRIASLALIVAGIIGLKLTTPTPGLEHLPRRLQGHVGVTPDVHGTVDDHDVAVRKPGLDQVVDDLLCLVRALVHLAGDAAGHEHTAHQRTCCHSREHFWFPLILNESSTVPT